jgi:hypothetical protein
VTAVNVFDGIKYGFRLMGYILGVLVVGGIIMFVGVGIMSQADGGMYSEPNTGSLLLGGLLLLFGGATIYAGFMGTAYKVIADGVQKGNIAAKGTSGVGAQSTSAGGKRGVQQRRQAQPNQRSRQQNQQPRQQSQQSNNRQGSDRRRQ